MYVQPVAICLIWCRVVRSRDFSAPTVHTKVTAVKDRERMSYMSDAIKTSVQPRRRVAEEPEPRMFRKTVT